MRAHHFLWKEELKVLPSDAQSSAFLSLLRCYGGQCHFLVLMTRLGKKSAAGTIWCLNVLSVTMKQFSFYFFSVVELSVCPGPQSLQENKELETIMLGIETTPRTIRALLPSPCRSCLRNPREGRQQGNTSLCNCLLVTAGTMPVCTWHKPIQPFHNKVNVHQNGKWTRMNHGNFQCIYPLAQIQVH